MIFFGLLLGIYKKGALSVDNSIKDDNSIYPNPAEDYIEISTNNVIPSQDGILGSVAGVRIYDILGTEFLVHSQLSIFNYQLTINVSHLSPGIYFVRIGNVLRKFVKM